MEDYNGVLPYPVPSPLMNVKWSLFCTPPFIPLLLGSCVWKGWEQAKLWPVFQGTGVWSGGLSNLVLIQPPEMNLCHRLRRQL